MLSLLLIGGKLTCVLLQFGIHILYATKTAVRTTGFPIFQRIPGPIPSKLWNEILTYSIMVILANYWVSVIKNIPHTYCISYPHLSLVQMPTVAFLPFFFLHSIFLLRLHIVLYNFANLYQNVY